VTDGQAWAISIAGPYTVADQLTTDEATKGITNEEVNIMYFSEVIKQFMEHVVSVRSNDIQVVHQQLNTSVYNSGS